MRGKIIRECERCFHAKDDRTIKAKKELASALEWGDRKNEALEIRRQIFELFDERDEESYIRAADNFADALEISSDYKSALPLRRKIVTLYEKNNDDESLYCALRWLIETLGNFSDKEYLEERAERYSQYVALCKKTGEEILNVMEKIADVFDNAKNSSEETAWRERILDFCRENLLEDAFETMNALDNLIRLHERLKNYYKVEQYRQQLHIIKEKNLGSSHKDVIDEKENIADTLHDSGKYDEEIKLRKQIIKLYRENFNANAENKKGWYWTVFIRAMERLATCFDNTRQKMKLLAFESKSSPNKKNISNSSKKIPLLTMILSIQWTMSPTP